MKAIKLDVLKEKFNIESGQEAQGGVPCHKLIGKKNENSVFYYKGLKGGDLSEEDLEKTQRECSIAAIMHGVFAKSPMACEVRLPQVCFVVDGNDKITGYLQTEVPFDTPFLQACYGDEDEGFEKHEKNAVTLFAELWEKGLLYLALALPELFKTFDMHGNICFYKNKPDDVEFAGLSMIDWAEAFKPGDFKECDNSVGNQFDVNFEKLLKKLCEGSPDLEKEESNLNNLNHFVAYLSQEGLKGRLIDFHKTHEPDDSILSLCEQGDELKVEGEGEGEGDSLIGDMLTCLPPALGAEGSDSKLTSQPHWLKKINDHLRRQLASDSASREATSKQGGMGGEVHRHSTATAPSPSSSYHAPRATPSFLLRSPSVTSPAGAPSPSGLSPSPVRVRGFGSPLDPVSRPDGTIGTIVAVPPRAGGAYVIPQNRRTEQDTPNRGKEGMTSQTSPFRRTKPVSSASSSTGVGDRQTEKYVPPGLRPGGSR